MPNSTARFASVTSSHVAAVAKPLRERMAQARGGWMLTALMVSTVAVAFIPGIGVGIAWMADLFRNGVVADRQKKVLADHYKTQISATLGIDPTKVTLRDLDQAARVNPMIASAIEKVNQEKSSANRSAAVINGAIGAVSWVPGVGALGEAGKVAVHLSTAVAGAGVSSLFDKNVLTVADVMEHIDAKQKSGAPIVANDVLMLRIAQNEHLQQQLKAQNGIAFHKMNEAQQQAVIATMPSGMFAEATESAAKVNSGQMEAQHLLMTARVAANENNQGNWAARVGGPRSAAGSFVDAENARAAAISGRPLGG